MTQHTAAKHAQQAISDARPQVAGFDTIIYSSKARISQAVRATLDQDKATAQQLAHEGAAYCPDWLGARVLPNGGRGYSIILETEDFTVKVAGEHMVTWPGLYVELRSFFLHTHEGGARGAVEESLAWIRAKLLYDQKAQGVREVCSFETVTPSRFDLHIDWQGGFTPTFDSGEVERFIKPQRVKWHPYFEGTRCTGYRFGSVIRFSPASITSLLSVGRGTMRHILRSSRHAILPPSIPRRTCGDWNFSSGAKA